MEPREDWRTPRKDWLTAGKDCTGSGRLVTQPTSTPEEVHPTLIQRILRKKQPAGPPRGEMEDGPNRTDYTVTTVMETDNEMYVRTPGKEEKILRKCGCGWEKVATFRGVRIHQGKRKCGHKGQQKLCTALAGETRGTESQDENHRADGPNVVEGKGLHQHQAPMESPTSSIRTAPRY